MNLRRWLLSTLIALLSTWTSVIRADTVQDWGTIATPLSSEVSFSFAQYNLTENFSDQYLFSLEGGAGATYAVTFAFDPCRNGCGSPELSYGIYDLNGSLIADAGGTVTLSAGNYAFQVKGTGMGSGNNLDYWGSVTFALASPTIAMVSPAPEPSTLILMSIGLLIFVWKLRTRTARLAGLLALPVLAACGPLASAPAPGQVMARVGDVEISMLQFNHALERLGLPNPGQPIREEVAAKLVDRELAVQAALAQSLDRQPEVLLRLEEARRDVLAQAYAEHTAAGAPRPDDRTQATFYAEHPELFAERKIFRLREVALPKDIAALPTVRNALIKRETLPQITANLRTQGYAFNEQVVIRAAEQLPIEALPKLNAAREGDTVVFESPRGVIAYGVLAAQPAGVDWDAAKPIVRDYLARRAGKAAVDARLAELRGRTELVYLGDFAPR